jgi:D-serine deaminase-like pyridoxal phosphate-dependent protein
MIRMAGHVSRLRPHIKTHKTAEIIMLQLEQGIHKFKCATIAEAELLAQCGAQDVLLALQPVEANVGAFFALMGRYPKTLFSTLVDNGHSLQEMASMAAAQGTTVSLWMDINNGMDRTGIEPNERATALYTSMAAHPHVVEKGFHVYDGHLHGSDPLQRKIACDLAFEKVLQLKNALKKKGLAPSTIVAGGTPTFPIHAQREGVETSPGTPLLWDAGYGNSFLDLDFLPAAVLATRVISKPKSDLVCFDLGHKLVASEMPLPRVRFLSLEGDEQLSQSEEHLVIRHPRAQEMAVGDLHYAIPMHICPTVAKYPTLLPVVKNEIVGQWKVAARDHRL